MASSTLPWDWDDPERIAHDTDTPWVDTLKPFSQSALWQMQQAFYTQTNTQAWDAVPFFLTSNPLLADIYMSSILAWLSDHHDTLEPASPVYLLELGAGYARFGFHMIKTLQRKRRFFPKLANIQFCYVLSDCAESQINDWANNPLFHPWLRTGLLDMGMFLPDQQHEIYLHYRQEPLNANTLKNPLIAIANYFYDSLPHDFFVTRPDGIDEVRLSLYRTQADAPEAIGVHGIGLALSRHSVSTQYYPQPEWNELLAYYASHCRPDTEISLPVGGLATLNNLLTLSQGRLMVVSADKAIDAPSFMALRSIDSPRDVSSPFNLITHGGAFSVDVNYHATSHVTTQLGGQAYNTSLLNAPLHIQMNTFLRGHADPASPSLDYYVHEVLNTHNPIVSLSNRMAMLDAWECHTSTQLVTGLQSLFQLVYDSHYDPYLLKRYSEFVTDLPDLNDHIAAQVEDLLDRCRDNLFNVPLSDNVYSVMGLLYRCCGVPDKAIDLMLEGLDRFGGTALLYNLLSLCHSDRRHYSDALNWAHKALSALSSRELHDEQTTSLSASIQARIVMWQELVADGNL